MVRPVARLATLCALVAALYTGSSTASASSSSGAGGNDSTITTSSTGDLIGWFDCSTATFADEVDYIRQRTGEKASELPTAQCAQYKAPLCHTGICEDPKKRTIDVFFKRIQATSDPQSKPSVWFLQGGPGAASPTMELAMASLYKQLSGNVNVYTMDHRGTGRSTLLDCVATQATTSGSPSAGDLSTTEVADCAKNLETKFGSDLSAFSITSAATDIQSFIKQYQSGSKTFVYGVSYGTALVERLMHLDTEEIVGYVLDGVSTTSGADVKDGMYMSNWDTNFGEVGDYFLSLCSQDAKCAARFPDSSIQDVLNELVSSGSSSCLWTFGSQYSLPNTLGLLLMRPSTRSLIPAVLYRINRCSYEKSDYSAIGNLVSSGLEKLTEASEEVAFESTLLYYLIIFSEMWESPTPSSTTLSARFANASMSTGPIASMLPLFCMFTKDNSSACSSNKTAVNYAASPIAYKKDKYWNVAAKIPSQASVLLMSGTLDPQTPHKYAERLLTALDGSNKELVTFPFATHGTLFSTAIPNAVNGTPTCGMSVLASYVASNGDLSKLNKTCLSTSQLSWEPSKEVTKLMFSTTEAFDGGYDESDWINAHKQTKKYVTELVVVSVCTAVLLFAAVFLCVRNRKRKVTEVDEDEVTVSTPGSAGQYFSAVNIRV